MLDPIFEAFRIASGGLVPVVAIAVVWIVGACIVQTVSYYKAEQKRQLDNKWILGEDQYRRYQDFMKWEMDNQQLVRALIENNRGEFEKALGRERRD